MQVEQEWNKFIGSLTSLWTLMFVCWLVGWSVGLSICQKFLKRPVNLYFNSSNRSTCPNWADFGPPCIFRFLSWVKTVRNFEERHSSPIFFPLNRFLGKVKLEILHLSEKIKMVCKCWTKTRGSVTYGGAEHKITQWDEI